MIERLAVSWEDASFAVVAALAWLSASLVSCPRVSVKSVSKAGVEITAAIPSPGPIMVSIEDDDREFQEDDLEPCGAARCAACFAPLSHSLANHAAAECLPLRSDSGAAPAALLMKARAPFAEP